MGVLVLPQLVIRLILSRYPGHQAPVLRYSAMLWMVTDLPFLEWLLALHIPLSLKEVAPQRAPCAAGASPFHNTSESSQRDLLPSICAVPIFRHWSYLENEIQSSFTVRHSVRNNVRKTVRRSILIPLYPFCSL